MLAGSFRGLVFDIGGVLAHDVQEHLFDKSRGVGFHYQLPAELVCQISTSLWHKYAYTCQTGDDWSAIEQSYWRDFLSQTKCSAPIQELIDFSKRFIQAVNGMELLVKRLKSDRFDLIICSNNTEFWFKRQSFTCNLGNYFDQDKIILSNRVGHPKDSQGFELFEAVERVMDHKKENYIYVDDRVTNIEQSIKFGIRPIMFPSHSNLGAVYLEQLIYSL